MTLAAYGDEHRTVYIHESISIVMVHVSQRSIEVSRVLQQNLIDDEHSVGHVNLFVVVHPNIFRWVDRWDYPAVPYAPL